MQRIGLNGVWQFKALDTYNTLPRHVRRVQQWMAATVPGTVHTDLMANRVIPDPFYRTNEHDVQWVDTQQWVYRRSFTVPAALLRNDRVELVAEGLDTYATIRINGREVAQTANMFIAHRMDVREHLHSGENSIEIVFDSPVIRSKHLEQQYGKLHVALQPHRVYVRKAQYSFGWDWGPQLTTSGIWRNIGLEAFSVARLEHPSVKVLSISSEEAVLELSVDIMRTSEKPLRLRTYVGGHGMAAEHEVEVSGDRATLTVHVPRPHLWWPNGYGEQPMYTAVLSLLLNDEEIDAREVPFGIRTVRLVQEPDSEGTSFIIEINGEKIFCKGADWIPCDVFLPRVADTTYERLLTLARDAHMNMLRVWGGGIYEQEPFYRLCDELGLMVWQDFMFACGEYPEEPWFLQHVTEEAEHVVRRLRNHPSLVLWCGNNECEWLFCTEHPGKSPDDMRGAAIFRDILPSVCATLDGTRPYWRSSPFGDGFPNAQTNGNHHQWEVWSGWKDFPEFEKDNARFVTEFGFQSPANRKTLERVTTPGDRHPQSMVMEHHNKQIEGTERLFRFLAAHQNVTTAFDTFLYRSQLVQAEALKRAVEHWRRRKFNTAGTLFWQLNDCWPVSSWSVIDSALRPKAAYYYARRFFAPVLLSFRRDDMTLEVWITNDTMQHVSAPLVLQLRSFTGAVVWRRRTRVSAAANSSLCVARVDLSRFASHDPTRHYVYATMEHNTMACEQRYFFVEPKHLQLPVPRIAVRIQKISDEEQVVLLNARNFAKDVSLDVEGKDVFIEDNYFDVDAGSMKRVRVRARIADLRKRLSISSLHHEK
jgi:beta-mannosidase